MFAVITCLHRHDPERMLWAVLICALAILAGLDAYRRATMTNGAHRAVWIASAAFILGGGGWAFHFMAMLAFQTDLNIGFSFGLTALSLLIAIAGTAVGMAISVRGRREWSRWAGGAIFGGAIALMHFVGVAAMRMAATSSWDLGLVFCAVAVAIVGAAAAFAATSEFAKRSRWIVAGGLLVVAVGGLHFLAMSAMVLTPTNGKIDIGPYGRTALSYAVLAFSAFITIASVALANFDRISGTAMLLGLRDALNGVPSAMAAFDADDRLLIWNQSYAELCGQSEISLERGAPFTRILGALSEAGLSAAAIASVLRARALHETIAIDPYPAADGRWFQPRIGPTSDGGFVVLLTDITEHLELARRETEARLAAEAAHDAKNEFLANMSHEIRTPLNGVLGMAQIMATDDLAPRQQERLKVLSDSGFELLAVMDGLLDLCDTERGELALDERRFELTAVIEAATKSIAPMAHQRRLNLVVEVDAAAHGAWWGDNEKLRLILAHLLSNALKFTDRGSITVRANAEASAVAFDVIDTGIGVSVAKQKMIFDAFSQADASATRRHGGVGLGLALCRRYVALMGGELTVRSAEGAGSTFSFRIPLRRVTLPVQVHPVTEEAPAEAAVETSQPLTILAAEDNVTNQWVLKTLLEPLGVILTVVDDGRRAVEAWRDGSFDLILMDIQMPEMDGVEASRKIREDEHRVGRGHTPILAVTANVMPDQVASYAEAGMDGVIAKPIDVTVLLTAIENALAGDRPGLGGASASTQAA